MFKAYDKGPHHFDRLIIILLTFLKTLFRFGSNAAAATITAMINSSLSNTDHRTK